MERNKLNAGLDHFGSMGYRACIEIIPSRESRTLLVTVPFVSAIDFEEAYRRFFNDEPPFPERPVRTGTLVYRIT